MRLSTAILAPLILFGAAHITQASDAAFDTGRTGFSIEYRGMRFDYRVMSICVLPAEPFAIRIVKPDANSSYSLQSTFGSGYGGTAAQWQLKSPDSTGLYQVSIHRFDPVDSMTINIFVMVPFESVKDEYLNGYRIGRYPRIPYLNLEVYRPPVGFIEVTPEIADTRVSPHFTLGQFVCKQEGEYPKYIALREQLLMKLELVLERLNERGIRCSTFSVLSGFRTPFYNRAIGNVKYSRHQWGGAADIFVDESPKDDMMDDLNGDGKINSKDAAVIYDVVNEIDHRPVYAMLIGGLSRYQKTSNHGPFVHVDVRGRAARW